MAQYNAGAFAAAKTQLEALAKQFPNHARTAETRDMTIWATIGAAHTTKPPESESPGRLGRAPGGTAVVYVVNGSPEPLTIMYQGPVTGVVTVPACSNCTTRSPYLLPLPGGPEETCGTRQSPVATLRLPPGSYKVLLQGRHEGGLQGGRMSRRSGLTITIGWGLALFVGQLTGCTAAPALSDAPSTPSSAPTDDPLLMFEKIVVGDCVYTEQGNAGPFLPGRVIEMPCAEAAAHERSYRVFQIESVQCPMDRTDMSFEIGTLRRDRANPDGDIGCAELL